MTIMWLMLNTKWKMKTSNFQIKLLQLFDQNFNSEFTINQTSKKTNFDYAYVNREVNKLIKKGIISKKTVGNAHLCSLNLKNDETISIIFDYETRKKSYFYKKHKVLKTYLSDFFNEAKKYDIHSFLIFGSYAKESETKKSDLDILIILENKAQSGELSKSINDAFKLATVEISPIIIGRTDFIKMLTDKTKLNIGKESLKNHIILYGIERFWELALESRYEQSNV